MKKKKKKKQFPFTATSRGDVALLSANSVWAAGLAHSAKPGFAQKHQKDKEQHRNRSGSYFVNPWAKSFWYPLKTLSNHQEVATTQTGSFTKAA